MQETPALIPGRATSLGTAAYHERIASLPGSIRRLGDLSLSSVGLGTYLGADNDEIDDKYAQAIFRALQLGANVLDAAINYRSQRSERVIGRVLQKAFAEGLCRREEIVIATKAGYIPFEGSRPRSVPVFVEEEYVQTGIVTRDELVSGVHCMSPGYLADQIDRSRRNLGMETIDVYYLHNPESHLEGVSRAEFMVRLGRAFEAFERAVSDGKIAMYGTATWHGYRKPESEHIYHSLADFVAVAKQVGGEGHHFRVVQLPYNLAMPEAFANANQRLPDGKVVPFLEAATDLGIYVMASAPILQGQLTERLPVEIRGALGLDHDAQRALQFVRSTPGIGTALAGMKDLAHVEQNLAVEKVPPAEQSLVRKLFELT